MCDTMLYTGRMEVWYGAWELHARPVNWNAQVWDEIVGGMQVPV
jgi:hypothetical protein